MYYPYMRGKQYELITVREAAKVMADAKFVPTIVPVRSQMRGLRKALEAVCEAKGKAVLIVNPEHGELAHDHKTIPSFLDREFGNHDNVLFGVRLHSEVTAAEAICMCREAKGKSIALIHAGFKHANSLAVQLGGFNTIRVHMFMEDACGKLYQKKFWADDIKRILVRDGFEHRRNRDHPDSEFFSDLHITYNEERVDGFGDFLIVGDEYSEGGGPAYAIAIHLTYVDLDRDGEMHVRHFLSDRQDTPADPGGKFAEALKKLIAFLDDEPSGQKVDNTSAIEEFRYLHERQHYPGLGYVKKLSMKHHIETLAAYFKNNPSENT